MRQATNKPQKSQSQPFEIAIELIINEFYAFREPEPKHAQYYGVVEKVIRIDRASVVAAAAARELNDELTVLLSSLHSVQDQLEKGHPALATIAEMQGSLERCAWKASEILEFSSRRGVPPVGIKLERLLAR